jgi:hypothetical protein
MGLLSKIYEKSKGNIKTMKGPYTEEKIRKAYDNEISINAQHPIDKKDKEGWWAQVLNVTKSSGNEFRFLLYFEDYSDGKDGIDAIYKLVKGVPVFVSLR